MKKIIGQWYLFIIIGFTLFAAAVFLYFGEDSYLAIHDNLDLFIPQYQMMKNTGTFWTVNAEVPFLGGISRNNLPAEFSLYTMLYMIMPAFPAYITGYFLKLLIAVVSCFLLAKEITGEAWREYKPLMLLMGFVYGLLNVFPNFGIPFASIPLVLFFLIRIYRSDSIRKAAKWYVLLLLYPLLSYFSYFGLFILAYLCAAIIWLWVKEKKVPLKLMAGLVILSCGYIICEWRLFALMLFGDVETIRSTMVAGSLGAGDIVKAVADVWAKGMFHAESVHNKLVLPVCVLYFLYLNYSCIRTGRWKEIFRDRYNLIMLVILFNSIIYGIYYWEGFRNAIEAMIPPLTGWQFNRTVFFNPFLWYAAFFLVLKRLYERRENWSRWIANVLAVAAFLVVAGSGTRYHDLYYTCDYKAHEILKGHQTDQLSFREFYSLDLFEKAKSEIGYDREWSAAYGFYPAVLQYNDIATLDGYLGFYSQEYKEKFRKVIAPALERVEASREYYDDWGARAYLYSGTDLSAVTPTRDVRVTDYDLYIDTEAFKALGGTYIFSRIRLGNAEEKDLSLAGVFEDEQSPYELYVYKVN